MGMLLTVCLFGAACLRNEQPMDKTSRNESSRIGFLRNASPLAIAMVSMTTDAIALSESDTMWTEFDGTVPAFFE